MTSVLEFVKAVVATLLSPDEVLGITAKAIEGGVEIIVRPATARAAGVLIGKRGDTVNALRHLASRAGKRVEPRLESVVVTVVAP